MLILKSAKSIVSQMRKIETPVTIIMREIEEKIEIIEIIVIIEITDKIGKETIKKKILMEKRDLIVEKGKAMAKDRIRNR